MLSVAILCEYSGRCRDAFIRKNCDAVSCDIVPSISPGPHIIGDCRQYDWSSYDLVIAFPPCTHLAVSGARWFRDKVDLQTEALGFVQWILNLPVKHICLENPVGIISTRIRKPDQIIQPWMFGDPYQKTTCLWLKNLPKLVATNVVSKGEFVIHGGKKIPKWYSNREFDRDLTFPGIAEAFASAWSNV